MTDADEAPDLPVISLFSGAMGLDLGLERAGFRIAVAVECNPFAIATIRANRPDLPLIDRPIEDVTTDEILEKAGLKPNQPVLVAGGPSCQVFSTAGARGSLGDPRGELFEHFVRVVRESQPRFFVMENVRGLLSAAARHRPLNKRGPGNPALAADEELGVSFPGRNSTLTLTRLLYHIRCIELRRLRHTPGEAALATARKPRWRSYPDAQADAQSYWYKWTPTLADTPRRGR